MQDDFFTGDNTPGLEPFQQEAIQLERIEQKLDYLIRLMQPKQKKPKHDGARSREVRGHFDNWWKVWPVKRGKADALRAFVTATREMNPVKVAEFTQMIIDDTRNRVRQEANWLKGNGQFIPLPATYLRGKRYEDVVTPPLAERITLPHDMAALEKIAVDNGLHPPGQAPQQIRNIFEYKSWIEDRL